MPNLVIIVMGVSGCGKTTSGQALSEALDIPFFDADDYHPPSNITKMKSGHALNDKDRQPWLETLATLLVAQQQTTGAILACSALKAAYRQTLEQQLQAPAQWVHLVGDQETILARMQARAGHFMPSKLLASQFETLESPTDALDVPITWSLGEQLNFIVGNIGHR